MHLSSPVCPRLVLLLLGVEHVLPGLHRAGVQGKLLVAGGRDHVGVGVAVTDGGARLLLGVGASAIDNVANTPILALAMSHVIEKNQDTVKYLSVPGLQCSSSPCVPAGPPPQCPRPRPRPRAAPPSPGHTRPRPWAAA